ncbi:MAG TPA: hypothetical protein VFG71_04010 [Nitrospiraceae bacterium]|nr:hypothetical protein [Nitrospiraceae bacterium]
MLSRSFEASRKQRLVCRLAKLQGMARAFLLLFTFMGLLVLRHADPLYAGNQLGSDRTEAGLIGTVKSVETIENLVKETYSYDNSGRLVQRMQEPIEGRGELGRIAVTSEYDAAGLNRLDTVCDHTGAPIKRTVFVHDNEWRRLAEVTAWADGTFVNSSFYEYDDKSHRIREVHFNAPSLINQNRYRYDEQGRIVGETYSRNYAYDEQSGQLFQFAKATAGYHVAVRYNAKGFVAEKIVHDLHGARESRSEFDYDVYGQQTEERIYDRKNRMIGRKRYEYSYDSVGNWVTETLHWWTFAAGKPHLKQEQTRRRVIAYFP